MKEAAGEANMTVITIVLIAIVLTVGTIVVNSLMRSVQRSSCCETLGGVWQAGQCTVGNRVMSGANLDNNSACR